MDNRCHLTTQDSSSGEKRGTNRLAPKATHLHQQIATTLLRSRSASAAVIRYIMKLGSYLPLFLYYAFELLPLLFFFLKVGNVNHFGVSQPLQPLSPDFVARGTIV